MNGLIRNIAICILAATVSHAAGGFDLRVKIETERSRSAVAGLFPEATYPNGWTIAKGVWHQNDSVYRFKDLPDESIQVRYVIDGSQWATDIPEPTDSITIRIPDVMLMQSLSEVTVQADRQYMTDDKSVYVPSRRDKKISLRPPAREWRYILTMFPQQKKKSPGCALWMWRGLRCSTILKTRVSQVRAMW